MSPVGYAAHLPGQRSRAHIPLFRLLPYPFVFVGEGGGNGSVGTGDGVNVPPTVGDAVGVTDGVPELVGEIDGEGFTDPFGVGETRMAVKKAAWGMLHFKLPFTKSI